MQIMYQLGCFRFGKYASSQATYSSAVMFPSVHSSRIVRALYARLYQGIILGRGGYSIVSDYQKLSAPRNDKGL